LPSGESFTQRSSEEIYALDESIALESESLLIGGNFGVGTDVQTGPSGSLYVVSLDRGVVYEIFRRGR
jgi:hypothetical protein